MYNLKYKYILYHFLLLNNYNNSKIEKTLGITNKFKKNNVYQSKI